MTKQPLIFGEILFDCFPDNREVLGGAPFNVAWHLQGFGFEPTVISSLGADEKGQLVRSLMNQWSLSETGIQTDSNHQTGIVDIRMDGTSHTFEITENQAYDHIEAQQALEASKEPKYSLLYHGSLALRSEVSRKTFNKLRTETGLPCFLDLNLRTPWWSEEIIPDLMSGATWVKLNDEELAIVSGEAVFKGGSLDLTACKEAAVKTRSRFELEKLVVTMGKDGAFVVENDGEIIESTPVPVETLVDTVGAGDAFASVFIAGLLSAWDSKVSLARALTFASEICGIRGATTEDTSLYQKQLSRWEN